MWGFFSFFLAARKSHHSRGRGGGWQEGRLLLFLRCQERLALCATSSSQGIKPHGDIVSGCLILFFFFLFPLLSLYRLDGVDIRSRDSKCNKTWIFEHITHVVWEGGGFKIRLETWYRKILQLRQLHWSYL